MDLLFDFFTTLEKELQSDLIALRIKILDKINIIKRLYSLNIIPDFNRYELYTIVNEMKKLFTYIITQGNYSYLKKNYDILNKKLGGILHSMYTRSGYHILLRNIPMYGVPKEMKEREMVTSHHIYDTLVNVFGIDMISNVLQVNDTTYLVKVFKYDEQSKLITDSIHGKQIEDKIIQADVIEIKPLIIDDIDHDSSIDFLEKPKDELSDSWTLRMFKYACSVVNRVKGLALHIH
jgi:hypothetical protein